MKIVIELAKRRTALPPTSWAPAIIIAIPGLAPQALCLRLLRGLILKTGANDIVNSDYPRHGSIVINYRKHGDLTWTVLHQLQSVVGELVG